jgi:DNA-binding PadR family transcriptional regulator
VTTVVSKVEVVVLGLLAEEPMYGYDLLERFRSRSMVFWVEVGKASIYQALHRLEERRLVHGRQQEGTEGPDRRVYRLTAAGRARLRAGLRERCPGGRPYETEAGLALGFVHLLPPDEARRAVGERETALAEWRAAVADERARTAAAGGPGRAVALRMLELQDALAEVEQRWLASFASDLPRLRR